MLIRRYKPITLVLVAALCAVSLWAHDAYSFNPPEPRGLTAFIVEIEEIPLQSAFWQSTPFVSEQIERAINPVQPKLDALSRSTSSVNMVRTRNQAGMGTCTVTTTADSGAGSLRQCLLDVGQNGTIDFDAQLFPPSAPATISLTSALPTIATDGLTIDGTNAGVIVSGNSLSTGTGFVVDGANGVTIKGLQILNFPDYGIRLLDETTNTIIGGDVSEARNIISGNQRAGVLIVGTNNQVLGNYIGTDATGMTPLGNAIGVAVAFGGNNNIVGGNTPAARNVISGNEFGVGILHESTNGNQVLGNYIGTDITGMAALGNKQAIVILAAAQENIIGGNTEGARNLISGNTEIGIKVVGAGTDGNQVLGNYIGTNATGTSALANEFGVGIIEGAQNNIIGGDNDAARNLISGNQKSGIQMEDAGTNGNQVIGNYIGTDVTGQAALANYGGVVIMAGAKNNIVGGETAASRNIISGNGTFLGGDDDGGGGIRITDEGTTGNQVLGNYIGTDVTGTEPMSNFGGVLIDEGASQNVIGGDISGTGNLISGNIRGGVVISGQGTTHNEIQGNRIGTDHSGQSAIPNGIISGTLVGVGVGIAAGASDNLIGGNSSATGNLISGNAVNGIEICDGNAERNQILGNYIGTDITGKQALGNGAVGIAIGQNAKNNVVGGAGLARNIISGNQIGVQIQLGVAGTDSNCDKGEVGETSGNQILGNYIGTDATGTQAVGNTEWGVNIAGGATNNTIGGETEDARNIISGNHKIGVVIQTCENNANNKTCLEAQGYSTTGNEVIGNYIGTDVTGSEPLKNGVMGVAIILEAKNNIIGRSNAGNLISGNAKFGIYLEGKETTDNKIVANYIGTDVTGKKGIPNVEVGVYFDDGAYRNTVGISNTIAYNGQAGVRIAQFENETTPLNNSITRNMIYENNGGPPIHFDWFDVTPPTPPMLTSYSNLDHLLLGSACVSCQIEIFAGASQELPEGRVFLGAVTTDSSGNFTLTLNNAPPFDYLSATATDSNGMTSEFSAVLPIDTSQTATPTATASATPTATSTITPTATPTATSTITPTATPTATSIITPDPENINIYLPIVIK